MVVDSNGNILTDVEFNRMSIKDIRIRADGTKALSEKLNKLIVGIEHTEEYFFKCGYIHALNKNKSVTRKIIL